ncbi:MAG: hypothetical protein CMB46_02625, partial [Euryarchaeota archaeon]|nr:hypothetical protein [Euryarchaeota archaeon]
MRSVAVAVVLLMVSAPLSGCFGDEVEGPVEADGFDFAYLCPGGIANNTWYHYSNATDATKVSSELNGTSVLVGNNAPSCAIGTYYGVGMTTFEPTIGVTSSDNLYMSSYGNGVGGSTAIIRCSGLIGMANISDYDCVDVYAPPLIPVVNSNDPYVYVDPWTDRIMKFDMHALTAMTVETSDNEGETWSLLPTPATGTSVQDHQTIASSPYPTPFHPTTWVFCINGNWQSPLCSSSFDGGITWTQQVPGAPLNCNSGGLTGHIMGSENGNFYRGNRGCNGGEGYSIYRSTDGGLTWSEHPLPTETTGTAETWNFEEAQVYPDSEDNVHAMWMGSDNMPYYSYSMDEGDTWSEPMMVAPPIGLNGTGFPVIAAGGPGQVALGYLGDSGGDTWNGYLTVISDAFSPMPLMTTVQVNAWGDPL